MGLKMFDIVYCVKYCWTNEELKYSLRSVEENWQYRKVFFAGCCPKKLKPDVHLNYSQTAPTKWERVRDMLLQVCDEKRITEDFWLFNDDFFILKKMDCENLKPFCNGTIQEHIEHIEKRHGGVRSSYTEGLRHMVDNLEKAGLSTISYAVHKPMLFNRKKLKEVLTKFPDEPMFRSLYGNYWNIGGEHSPDVKIVAMNYGDIDKVKNDWSLLSTSDKSFRDGNVGEFIRKKFTTRSRFEI